MENEALKNRLVSQLNTYSKNLDDETNAHGSRFIEKLSKYGVITNNLSMSLLDDGNLSFEWKFEKPKFGTFNIDFDKSSDSLNYCMYIEGMKNQFYGKVSHFDEIVPYLKRFLGFK